ncbi:MAG: MFS transporter, partial [Longimicrobiales bacterium]
MKKRPLFVLFAAVFVDMIGFGIVLPLLPFYAESLGASPLEVTILFASFSGMQVIAAPLWGRVSDRQGRRPLLVAGLFASAVSYLIFGLATSFWIILLSRVAAGAAGGTISVAQAYIADSTSGDERAAGMGHIGAASGLGVMVGPVIGGFFAEFGYGVPGFVAAGLCAANGLLAILFLPESWPKGRADGTRPEPLDLREWLRAFTRFPLSLLLGVYFLAISSFTAMTAVLALYMERAFDIGAREMGYLFTLAGLVTVVVRGALLGTLVRAFGEPRVVRLGVVLLFAAMTFTPGMPTAFWAILIMTLHAAGAGTLFPSLASLVSRATDEASQGSILGGSQIVGGLGRVVGPLWAGLAFQGLGIRSPFFIGAACLAAAWLLALRVQLPEVVVR